MGEINGGAGRGRGAAIPSPATGTPTRCVQDLPAAIRFTVQRHVFLMPANIRDKFKYFTFIALFNVARLGNFSLDCREGEGKVQKGAGRCRRCREGAGKVQGMMH